ncbi:anti-sigma factor domain-containing protein [Agromyces sp. LHK192]|uniref:anti-sigma factor n=1 Tax=Agromyces sp. LHK192 TaxID=2498704 RepID=UPI000FDB380A|nr:anti-sigma factor [Agromyces sp. LHK192]
MTGPDASSPRVPDDLRDLVPAYALGALDEFDRARFERALATAPELQEEVDAFRAAATEALGGTVAPVEPPPSLKAGIFDRLDGIEQEPSAPAPATVPVAPAEPAARTAPAEPPAPVVPDELAERRRRRGRLGVLLAGAAAVVLIVGTAIVGVNWGGPNGWGAQRDMASLAEASDAQQTTAQVTGGGEVTLVSSAEQGRSAIIAEGLEDVGEGRTYELWYIGEDSVVSAGTFDVRNGETWRILDGAFEPGVAVGITVEPAGGSPEPTTEPIAVLAT